MGNSSSAPRITTQDKAILQLKLQRDKLNQTQTKMQAVISAEVEVAKKCLLQGNKERAKLSLRKKKNQESMIAKIYSQIESLEQLISSIEFKLIEKNVVYGLEQGNSILKQLNQELNMNRIEKLMDDTEEGIRYQEEVSEMLGSSMSRLDEDEVDEELKAMEREARKDEKVQEEAPIFPEAPTGVVQREKERESDSIEETEGKFEPLQV